MIEALVEEEADLIIETIEMIDMMTIIADIETAVVAVVTIIMIMIEIGIGAEEADALSTTIMTHFREEAVVEVGVQEAQGEIIVIATNKMMVIY